MFLVIDIPYFQQKLGPGSDFPTGDLPSPAIVSTSSSKTVLRLKIPATKESTSEDDYSSQTEGSEKQTTRIQKKKEKLKKKGRKVKGDSQNDEEKSDSDTASVELTGDTMKRRRGRPSKCNTSRGKTACQSASGISKNAECRYYDS